MVASFLQKCFGCKSSVDDTNECNTESIGAPVLEYSPSNPRAQDEELLSLLREPLLALEGSWFTRMRRLLDVLEERGGLRATLVGIVRGDLQPQTACYVLLESSNARTDDVVDQGYSFPFVNREAALVILQACVSKMAVPATTSRLAACVPLLHGGVAMGALWLTLETSQRKSLVMPAPAAPAAVRSSALGSGASGASMWPFYSGPAVSTTAAAALLANGTSLDTLAFTISMAVQGGDPDQLPWLTAAVHRLCAAGTMHTLAADLCDLLAAHVLRKFVLDTAVRAVLVPGDGSNGCPGTTTGPPDGNGSTAASVGYLLGASAGPNAAMGSPLQQSAASSRGLTRAQYSSMNGNPCSLNDASQLEPSPSVGVTVEAAVGPLGPAAEGQLQQHLPGLPRTASIGISTGLRASGLGPRAEPKPRRLSLLAAGSHSGGLPRDVIRASALNSGTQQPQDQQQAESTQHDQQQRTKPPPQQQLQQAALRQSPSLQQLMFQQQGQALGLGGFSHGQGRPPASWLLRRPHSVKSVMAAEPLPGLTAAAAAAVGGAPAAIAVDLILSRRTLSGTTTTRPLVVALPLGADPTAAAGPASAFLKTTDTRASKSANAANTCTNINSFLATAGCNSTSALMNSWQGGILPPPSTTVTAHTFPLQHTLLQVCSNAAASGNGSIGSGGDINNPAVVEDCCSLLQDVHRPCRDVCLLMGILSQQQELQKLQNLSPALAPPAVPTPLQRACVQLQEHLNATGAAAAASWRAVGIGGVCASPTGTPSPVRNGTGNNLASGPNGGSGAIFRGGGGLGAGLRSLVVVLVPSYKLTASSRGAAVDGAGAVVKNAPSSSGYMGLYVCFQARLPRSLLEAVRSSCQELVDEGDLDNLRTSQ
ncbi:hypothetical protein Vafri_11338 [Volvox africanus]|nr:hypothetical protein Vafri_11338 [Volvox africanus]